MGKSLLQKTELFITPNWKLLQTIYRIDVVEIDMIKNTMGKRRNFRLPVFSAFSIFFFPQKPFVLWSIKVGFIVVKGLTLFQTSPGFYVSAVQVFWKHCG